MPWLLILLLFLAACDAEPAQGDEAAADGALPAAAPPGGIASPAQQAAQNQQRASQALAVILVDPESARYSEVRAGTGGSVCGRVDAKQADGKYSGPRPFVVTPEGVAVISATGRVMFEDPEDLFPDFYIRWCASPEELRGLGPRIASNPMPDLNLAEDLTAIVEAEVPLPVTEPQPAETAKAPSSPSQTPPEDDSFSRAVLRNRSEGAPR